jgi:hypothetical protein
VAPPNVADPNESFMRVRATQGDFPHVGRRSVRLACCCCTSCCFTFLLGGAGGIAGLITGLVKGVGVTPPASETRSNAASVGLGFVRIVLYMLAYGIAGILIGAAVGFGIDFLFVFPH